MMLSKAMGPVASKFLKILYIPQGWRYTDRHCELDCGEVRQWTYVKKIEKNNDHNKPEIKPNPFWTVSQNSITS